MRLIDADQLRDTIINICGNCSNIIREYKEGVPDGNCAIQHIMNMIDNAPTVTPERPQGDLISRDALKDATKCFTDCDGFNPFWQIIDNAPTVEPCYQTTSCLECKMYDKEKHNCPRFCEVIRSAIEERQQGEWVHKEDVMNSIAKQYSAHNELVPIWLSIGEVPKC